MNIERELKIKATLSKCEDIDEIDPYFNQLCLLREDLKQNENFENLSKFFNALANKKRLFIINILKEKDRCVCEIETVLDESQPSISHHLRILEKVGLIKGWKKGKFTHYDVVKEQFKSYLDLFNEEIVKKKKVSPNIL